MEAILGILMALAIGGIALASGLRILGADRAARRWPTAAGTVVAREVVASDVGTTTTPGRRYRATVRYTYVVDDKTYEGDKILALGGLTGSREAMQREVDALTGPVAVRYNPENPAEACLRTSPTWWAYGALGGAALCFLVGLVMLVSLLARG